jgi:hypothetical protein
MRRALAVGGLFFSSLGAARAADGGIARHSYRKGETLRYYFEDTDYVYDAKPEAGLLRPKTLRSISGVRVNLRIRVVGVSSGTARRRIEFSDGLYRSAAPKKYNQAPSISLSSAIPGFPSDFGYEYDSDGKIVNRTGAFFAPYLSSEAGTFVFYKTMDIHTFQSIIDDISSAQRPGDIVIKPPKKIPLDFGVFRNGSSVQTYDRVDIVDGIRCAVFKVATPGNTFKDKNSKAPIRTDYQLTMFVPLEGEYRGLLLRGDLQESIFEKRDSYVLRQLSMTLRTK